MHGLPNLGNTCYLNTTLQCLLNSRYFCEFLKITPDILLIKRLSDRLIEPSGQLVGEYILTVRRIQAKIQSIRINETNDIHEFICHVFDVFFEEFKQVIPVKKPKQRGVAEVVRYNSDANWNNAWSAVCDLAYTQVIVDTKCSNCGHVRHNYEIISVLPLDIVNCDDLVGCFKKYFESSCIDMWVCDKCKYVDKRSVTQTWLNRLPNLLVVSLNRFDYRGGRVEKNCKTICIPKYIDLSCFMYFQNPAQSCKFRLSSCARHIGNVDNGHYNATISLDDERIILIDDTNISEIQYIDLDNSYVIFYERMKE